MRYILLAGIRLYWLLPKKHRRHCLFKLNCSKHVYTTTLQYGFAKGIAALKLRVKQCRPGGYKLPDGEYRLVDGSVVGSSEVNL